MNRVVTFLITVLALVATAAPLFAADAATEPPAWRYKNIVDSDFVAQYATVPKHGAMHD